MALGKDRDRVYMSQPEGGLEAGRIEGRADAGDLLGGVEIEVDLAVSHGGHRRRSPGCSMSVRALTVPVAGRRCGPAAVAGQHRPA
jgi:hypothetical protein